MEAGAEHIVYTPDKAVTVAMRGGANTRVELLLCPFGMIDCFEFQILVLIFSSLKKTFEWEHDVTHQGDLLDRILDSGPTDVGG